jgi:heme a synthase
MEDTQHPAIYRLAFLTSCATILLLMAGALVTSNFAADSVPDWPLAYHRIIPPMVGGIRYEFTHRVIAGLVAIFTLVLAIAVASAKWKCATKAAHRLGWTAFLLIIAQALLGAFRVLEGYPAISATAHAILAQIYFITIVSLTMVISPWWQRSEPRLTEAASPRLVTAGILTTLVIVVQLVLGAGFRHGAWGILPHLIGFVFVTGFVIWVVRLAKKRFGADHDIRKGVVLLHATFGAQVLLGIAAYWAVQKALTDVQPTFTYVILTVAHVLGGALVLASSVLLTLMAVRLIPGRDQALVPAAVPAIPRVGSGGSHIQRSGV